MPVDRLGMRRRDLLHLAGLCSAACCAEIAPASPQNHGGENLIRPVEGHPSEALPDGSSGRIVEFRSSDGTYLPAYLRTPVSQPPFALVMMVHGGQTGKESTYGLGRSSKAPTENLVTAGWAVFAIDYRP